MSSHETHESQWERWSQQWRLAPGVTYLNHGSFGPPPLRVLRERSNWLERMNAQPMDFFFRSLEPAWRAARDRLSQFVGASPESMVFVDNATVGMNIVADSFQLQPTDRVVVTDHEYGAVQRIWERACREADAPPPTIAKLPLPIESAEAVLDAIFACTDAQTRLLVISHITSPTAITLPIAEICHRARVNGIATCIDGPHAVAQLRLRLDELGCDFYVASCHKWLSAPFGSGFFYVADDQQAAIRPPIFSWGRLRPQRPESWSDEFIWSGTRDVTPYLAVPAAIDFLEDVSQNAFIARTHELARYARGRLSELTRLQPLTPDEHSWYGAMAHVPLPPVDAHQLQRRLWQEWKIEVPIVHFQERQYIRVSCHLYNDRNQIDLLIRALEQLLTSMGCL